MSKTKTITHEQLVEMLRTTATTIVSIWTETAPKMLAKANGVPNPYKNKQVVKRSKNNGIINFHYENAVNNRRVKEDSEPDFVAKPRQWGSRIPGTPLVEHKGNFYLEMKVERCLENEILVDGDPAPDDLKNFLPHKEEGSRQELESPVIIRDFKVDNIKAVQMNGEFYTVKA